MKMKRIACTLTTISLLLSIGGLPAMAGRNDRGITSLNAKGEPFMYKGSWAVGGSAGISGAYADKYGFAVIGDINYSGYSIDLKPSVLYALSDDFAIGAMFTYDRRMMDLASAGVSVASINIKVEDYNILKQNFGGAFFCRKYLTLGRQGRFAIFVDGVLHLRGGQGKVTNKQATQIVGTYEKSYSAGLSVNPGLAAYVGKHLVLSAGVGILGIDYSWTNQIHNQVGNGSRNGFGAAYTVNLLSLSVGAHYSF